MPDKNNTVFLNRIKEIADSHNKRIQEIADSHNKSMQEVISISNLTKPLGFYMNWPKFEKPKIDLDIQPIDVSNLLREYFEKNPISENIKKSINKNIANLKFYSYPTVLNNEKNNQNEKVVKWGEIKVTTDTVIDNITYVKMPTPKVLDDTSTKETETSNDKIIKDYTPLTDYAIQVNQKIYEFSGGGSLYSILTPGFLSVEFLVYIHVLHFLIAWLLVEIKHEQKLKLEEKDKE